MTPPVLLTVPTPLDARVGVDCHPHFSLSPTPASAAADTDTTHPFTIDSHVNATLPSDSDCSDAYAYSDTHADPYVVQRQWTGAPIRAIVPLPRRTRASPHSAAHPNVPTNASTHTHTHGHGPPTRSIQDDADADADTDSDSEITIEIVPPEEDEDEDDAERGNMGCYSYESITAAEGLSAWSFEELRAECYAQSLVARGTRPSPVVQPSLAIPPAFAPRVIPRR